MKALAAILLIVASTSVHAQKITGAEIVEYGIIKKIKSEGSLDAPNVLGGKVNNVIVSQLVQSTTTIKASIGTTFVIFLALGSQGWMIQSGGADMQPLFISKLFSHQGPKVIGTVAFDTVPG